MFALSLLLGHTRTSR